jgi:MSHA biogenesis protein MshN
VTQDAARPETADAAPPTAAGQTPDATVAPAAGETRELAADVSPATLPPRSGAQAGERAGLRPGNPSGHAADAGPAETVRYRPLRNVVEPPPLRGRHVVSASRAGDTAEVKTATPAPSDPLAAVRRAIDVGELAEAEALLEERLGRAPRDLEARELLLGLVLRGGRTDAALAQLALGLRDYPGHGSFILIRARLLAQAGDPEAAISVLESAPRSQTTRGERLQMLAALYQQQGRYGESAEAYRALLATAPGSGPAWAGLGVSLDAVGDPEAAAAYRRALELGGLPQAAEAYARDRLAQLGQGDG